MIDFFDAHLYNDVIEIEATKLRVSTCSLYIKYALRRAQNRNIECTTTEVEDKYVLKLIDSV